MQKALTLSVIILAYNEENQLPACLDALAAQTKMPDEVIVVDNNSTDNTAAIARSYPFVKLVYESEQGMIPARNRGFREARGEIFARIDADARVAPDWAERIYANFADSRVMAVAGVGRSLILPNTLLYTTLWSRGYLLWMRMLFNIPILWGTNMVLRRTAWDAIKNELHENDKAVHEDLDISVLMAAHNLRVITDTRLIATSESQDKAEWPKYSEYLRRTLRMRRYHQENGNLLKVQPLYSPLKRLMFVLFMFIPVKPIFLIFGVGTATLTLYMRQIMSYIDAYLDIESS